MLRFTLNDKAQKKTLLKDCRPGCWAVALCGRTHSDGLLHVNNGKHRLQWADGDTAGGSCGKGRISLNFNGAAEMIKNLNTPNKFKKKFFWLNREEKTGTRSTKGRRGLAVHVNRAGGRV